ncbi:ATP-binding protein [bacterium]|nr:ATP-binding protein [bacterium]
MNVAVTLHFTADTQKLPEVLDQLDTHLMSAGCPEDARMQLAVAVEEIFVNIANYAYSGKTGPATINIKADAHKASICFADSGFPYDPLKKEDPNIEQAAEDRPIGGLGIFLVKEMSDEVHYERRDDMNILTIVKKY